MSIVFDSELKFNRLRNLLLNFLEPLSSEFVIKCAALDSCSNFGGARLLFERLVGDLVSRIPLAYFPKDNLEFKEFAYARLFNGEYYEKISVRLVKDTIYSGWLFDHCKLNLKYYSKLDRYCLDSIIKALYYRRLEPSLRVMCFQNGVVDFKDMELKPFSSEYHCVKQYDFKWNPKADCPLWKRFIGMPDYVGQDVSEIEGILPEATKRHVLQKFLGGGFIDRKKVKFEYLMILYGSGANGKSVIKEVLDGIFGKEEIVSDLPFSALSKEGFDGFNSRYALNGCRFAYCTELSPTEFRRPEMVKAAASGEAMSARGIGQNVKVIKDIPIFMCNSNYDWGEVNLIPKDSPDDESMARRVLLLSFDKKVPEGKRDPELVDKLLLEKEGIFQWIVRGYRRLKRDKWKINDSLFGRVDMVRKMANGKVAINGKYVHGSIIEYINFKGISTIMDEKHSNAILLSSSDIYENYLSFCKSNGLLSVTSCHKFSLDFGNYGFSKRVGFGANNCNGYVMYWAEPHNTMIFKASVPSVEKILDMDALLEENEEEDEEF